MKQIIFTLFLMMPLAIIADVDEESLAEQENMLESTVKTLQNLTQLTKEKSKTEDKR